jgi:hypothetical protein
MRLKLETERALDARREMAQRFLWDWGGSERFLFLTYDDIDNNSISDKRRTRRSNNFYLWGNLNLDDIHNFYVRFHGEQIDWNSGDQYRSTENQFHWNLEEGFDEGHYTINIDRALESYLSYYIPVQMQLKAGRFDTYIGSQLAYIRRTNAIQLEGKSKWVDFKVFGARTLTDKENIDFSVPGFRSSRRYFYGAELKYNGLRRHQPFLYALIEEDDSGESPEDPFQDYAFDSRYFGIGSRGEIIKNLYYQVEGIKQGGKRFPEASVAGIAPDKERIEAWAFDASLNYIYNIITHPSFSVEYAFGSGDSDRTGGPATGVDPSEGRVTTTVPGNKEGTKERNFLSFGYIDTGLSLAPRLSNLQMFRFGVSLTPSEFVKKRNVYAGVDFFIFRRDKKEGAISDSRADRPQRSLGKEFDVNVTWQIFSDLSASVDYGRFYPSSAYSDKDARDFLMFTMLFQF